MEKTEEKEFKNKRERINELFKNIIKGYKSLYEIVEKLCATELPENSNSNVLLKDDTIFNTEIEMKADTLPASEINTIDSEELKSSRNFSDNTETLVSTLKCEEDIADEFSLDSMSEKSGSTDILLDWGSNTPSPRSTPDIDSELCDSPKKNLYQSVQKHSTHDGTGDITETSSPIAEDSEEAAVFFTAEQVREAIQQALNPLSRVQKSFDDFLSSHSLNTFRDLNMLENETKFSSSDLTHSTVGQLKNTGQVSDDLLELPYFAWKNANTAEENSCSGADFNNNAITDDEKISSIDLGWKYHLKTVDKVADHLKALEDFISGRNSERHEYLPSSPDTKFFLSGLQFQEEHFSLKSPNKNHKLAEKMKNIKNFINNEFPNIDQQSTVSSQPSIKINIITDNNQESNFNSDATVLKDSPYTSATTDEDWGNLSLVEKHKKGRRKLMDEFLFESYENVLKDSPYTSATTGEDWGNLSLAEKHKRDRSKLLNEFLSGSYLNESRIPHCDWKLTDSDKDLNIDKKSRQVLKILNFLQEYMIANNLSPSDIITIYEDVVSPTGSPDIFSTFGKDLRLTTSSTDDGHPDTLTDIFKTVLKCHPLKKFEIPLYASDNPDGLVGTAENRMDESCMELTPNSMPLHNILEHPPILGEYSSDIDSDSLIVFKIKDCFSENSSIICNALVNEYLNIAVKLNIFFLKKAEDVSLDEYEKRMDNLHCLDDELGYVSAKLITVKNDWIKQSEEIDQNLRNNSLMIKSSKGLYHKSVLKTCREVIRILLRFCFQKQLDLENYEKELVIKHGHN